MGRADYYKRGSWNAICDICGFKRKAEDLVTKTWFGGGTVPSNLYVCFDTCADAIQPQAFAIGIPDRQTPPWVRPPQQPVFVPDELNAFTRSLNGQPLNYESLD
jgi:hypothetical protein